MDQNNQQYQGVDRRPQQEKHKVKFDPTINLGHVLTFLGFIIAGFGAWSQLDKRLVVLEEYRNTQAQIDKSQDTILGTNVAQVKESLQDIKRELDKISSRLDRRNP